MSNILLIILAAAFAGLLYACRLLQQKHQLLQALQDDYQLINFHGNHISHSHIHESYLNLRLEELKFAALLQAEKAHSVQEEAEKILN